MAKKNLPVLQIEQFDHAHGSYRRNDHAFYTNTMSRHLKHHHFIHTPHKHDFFLCMIFTKGKGTHEIDFTTYPVKPGAVFIMNPGQTHNWQLSEDIEGYIFFHSKEFYEFDLANERLKNFPFFQSVYANPFLQTDVRQREYFATGFSRLLKEFEENKPLKMQRLQSLVRLLYIDLSRIYASSPETTGSDTYLVQLREAEALIDAHYKTKKIPV